MSFEQGDLVRHEDVVINDEEFVLPIDATITPLRSCESPEDSAEIPEDVQAFINEMRLTCGDLELCEFQVYNEEERGWVGGSLRGGSLCTISHLEAVWYNYCLVQWFCQIEGHGSLEAVEDLFSPVQNELQRLQDHPELFPGVEVMQKFWRRLDDALASITQAQLLIHERGTRHAALVSEDDKLMNAEKMPRRDVSRKPWEQYLHNRAPGVNVDLSDMGSDGSVQILPMGALRLLHTMKEANESIIRGIEAARRARGLHMPYQVDGRDPTLLSVGNVSPEGYLRTHRLRSDLLAPIENGPKPKSRPFAETELETLNEDFAAMRRRRQPGGRTVHRNFLCLVIHDHPWYP